MPGLVDYLANWKKMLGGAAQVDPNPTAGVATPGAAPAPKREIDPVTGFPKSKDFGRDIDLPLALAGNNAAIAENIAYLKRIGYPEDVATAIAVKQAQRGLDVEGASTQKKPRPLGPVGPVGR